MHQDPTLLSFSFVALVSEGSKPQDNVFFNRWCQSLASLQGGICWFYLVNIHIYIFAESVLLNRGRGTYRVGGESASGPRTQCWNILCSRASGPTPKYQMRWTHALRNPCRSRNPRSHRTPWALIVQAFPLRQQEVTCSLHCHSFLRLPYRLRKIIHMYMYIVGWTKKWELQMML